jgi:hypothetical protein
MLGRGGRRRATSEGRRAMEGLACGGKVTGPERPCLQGGDGAGGSDRRRRRFFFLRKREQRGFPRCGDGATAKPLWGLACGETVRGGGGSTSGGGLRCSLRFFSWESAWRNSRNNIRRYSSWPGRAGGPQHIPCVWCVCWLGFGVWGLATEDFGFGVCGRTSFVYEAEAETEAKAKAEAEPPRSPSGFGFRGQAMLGSPMAAIFGA